MEEMDEILKPSHLYKDDKDQLKHLLNDMQIEDTIAGLRKYLMRFLMEDPDFNYYFMNCLLYKENLKDLAQALEDLKDDPD